MEHVLPTDKVTGRTNGAFVRNHEATTTRVNLNPNGRDISESCLVCLDGGGHQRKVATSVRTNFGIFLYRRNDGKVQL